MKSTKSKKCTSAPSEDCGVWLDASERRAKQQQKQVRPISKLLNPLARAGGYSTAVALNFTQTKMQMPVTRQSTISSFFLPRSKTNEDPDDFSSSGPSWMSSTPLPQALTGTKRKREKLFELSSESDNFILNKAEIQPMDFNAESESKSERICKDPRKEQQFFHLIWGYQSDEPAEKRRPENTKIENITDTQQEGNETIFHGFKDSDELENTHETMLHKEQTQENMEDSPAPLTERDYRNKVPLKDRNVMAKKISTRSDIASQERRKNPFRFQEDSELAEQFHQASVMIKDKENIRPNNTEFSPVKQHLTLSNSPAKLNVHIKGKSCRTPTKSIRYSVESEEDSMAMLFTQDSEGFRVIANRSQWSRRPLKDQTNSLLGRDCFNISAVNSLESENSVEPEMLFTQDSQGNMVIKH
ncbi:aurora kinase A- and ninein-interacting protein [Trichomycterus rosablanca]|uniref:aurora kinase A- and ninein-interacting protein n=1 Tax=Trichomycterus rosablanca TaxID=2290929 RepID=UPI002F354BA7